MAKAPSPCISVCKYRLGGHCIACSMTKPQKSAWKGLSKKRDRRAFIRFLLDQQAVLGGRFKAWAPAYRRKCDKKDVPCPLDDKRL